MKNLNLYSRLSLFLLLLFVCFLALPIEACVENTGIADSDEAKIEAANFVEPIQTPTPQPGKSNKKTKGKSKNMNTKTAAVQTGIWGADNIIFNVEDKSVTIQYECADGLIEQSLSVDGQGSFAVNGFHIRQRPGPIRVDSEKNRQPVRFEGKISGDMMTLKVTLTETKEVIGEFTLTHGKTPRLHRCY